MAVTLYLAIGLAVVYLTLRTLKRRSIKLPPGPKGLPIICNLLDLPGKDGKIWDYWAKHREQYGPISSLSVMGNTIIGLHDYATAFEILEKKCGYSADRTQQTMSSELCGWGKDLALQRDDSRHQLGRKQFRNFIGTPALVSKFDNVLDAESHRFLAALLKQPDTLWTHIRKEAASIILDMTYGYTVDYSTQDPLVQLIEKSIGQLNYASQPGAFLVDVVPCLKYVPAWMPGASFKRFAADSKATVEASAHVPYQFVQHQMAREKAAPSFISSLHAKGGSEEAENAIWTAQAMYAGGSDTTVGTIATFFLAMMLNPDIQAEAQQEIASVIGEDRLPNISDQAHLPYIQAIVKECLRWHPVIPSGLPHRLTADYEFAGYTLPKGATVFPNAWGMAHDPNVYKDSHTFSPSRFLGPHPEQDPTQFIFGFGKRICPGRVLAVKSVFVTLARVLAVFNISKKADEKTGEVIQPTVDFGTGLISHPREFEVEIEIRGRRQRELVESVERVWPSKEGSRKELVGLM